MRVWLGLGGEALFCACLVLVHRCAARMAAARGAYRHTRQGRVMSAFNGIWEEDGAGAYTATTGRGTVWRLSLSSADDALPAGWKLVREGGRGARSVQAVAAKGRPLDHVLARATAIVNEAPR